MSPKDIIRPLDDFKIHHGKVSNRVYLMGYLRKNNAKILANLDSLANYHNYSKIIIKANPEQQHFLKDYGYLMEATIPNYSNGEDDAIFMAKYLKTSRQHRSRSPEIEEVFQQLEDISPNLPGAIDLAYEIIKISEEHVLAMVDLYKQVFETYPFDIFNPEYLVKTMVEGSRYFGAFHQGRLVGIANCRVALKDQAAEMTDFAVVEEHRGNQLARHLLKTMEIEMEQAGIKTLYTIARSISLPMNATFKRAGYNFGGTLTNNGHIAGSIESMNIWHKTFPKTN